MYDNESAALATHFVFAVAAIMCAATHAPARPPSLPAIFPSGAPELDGLCREQPPGNEGYWATLEWTLQQDSAASLPFDVPECSAATLTRGVAPTPERTGAGERPRVS